jgi:hypothetical protein
MAHLSRLDCQSWQTERTSLIVPISHTLRKQLSLAAVVVWWFQFECGRVVCRVRESLVDSLRHEAMVVCCECCNDTVELSVVLPVMPFVYASGPSTTMQLVMTFVEVKASWSMRRLVQTKLMMSIVAIGQAEWWRGGG